MGFGCQRGVVVWLKLLGPSVRCDDRDLMRLGKMVGCLALLVKVTGSRPSPGRRTFKDFGKPDRNFPRTVFGVTSVGF